MNLKERMLRNSGSTINESIDDKIKEMEIKERTASLITNFQRGLLNLVQYVDNGGCYNYGNQNQEKKMDEETIKKYKKISFMYLMSKVDGLKADIAEAFGEESDSEEEEEPETKVDVAVVAAPAPEMKMAQVSNFGY